MLREDTLRTIQTAIARGEPVTPTPDAVRAAVAEAHRLRAQTLRQAFVALASLFRNRALVLPPGKIDVVRGH
jgi:hypothetical protein